MIQSLAIKNFQSHKDSSLEFDPGVNIIIGNSDSGKTSIIRAIRKLVFNKPSGNEMKSHWGGELNIEMFTDDAHVVYKNDKKAEYILGDSHFKAFGTDVPEEITQALNLNTINIQQQLDSPFLLSESAGEVAKHFNKVARLDKIDLGLQNINSSIREITADIKYAEGQEISLTEELTKFEYLEKAEIDLEVLEGMEKRLTSFYSKKQKLMDLNANYYDNSIQIDYHNQTLELEEPINKILDLYNKKNDLEANYADIVSDIGALKVISKEIEAQQDLITIEKPLTDLLHLNLSLKTAVEQKQSLFKALKGINSIKIQLSLSEEEYTRLQAKFERLFPDICPLCGTKLK
jgi:exonuclease SbcC